MSDHVSADYDTGMIERFRRGEHRLNCRPDGECSCYDLLRQRLYVALVEQRVIDSRKYGEAPYAPVTWDDVNDTLARVTASDVSD